MGAASRVKLLFSVLLLAAVGAGVGLVVGTTTWIPSLPMTHTYPLPHHVSKYPGGVSLRFAMVHDVLHERFARHGEAYYRERNPKARQAVAETERTQPEGKRDAAFFALLDDLGAGLDYLKDHDEAVRVLRDKLLQQEIQGLNGRDLYTTYANLGTFLIHGSFREAVAGNKDARTRLREGLAFIRRSIEVNPQAPFGREVWQANAAAFFLAALDRPSLLLEYDMVGNHLAASVDPEKKDSFRRDYLRFLGLDTDTNLSPEERQSQREPIALVGAEEGWKEAVPGVHDRPVAFDEPTLGIVGMWRLGGGANPHFALALGEIMLRVGQRYIAWCAYERAALLAEPFWPDRKMQQDLIDHCRERQRLIERGLSENERSSLRPRFLAELAHGQRYQQEYQCYEIKRIQEGADLDDPHFYDGFFAGRESIATPPGPAERLLLEAAPALQINLPAIVFFAGLFAFAGAWPLRWWVLRQFRAARASEAALAGVRPAHPPWLGEPKFPVKAPDSGSSGGKMN